MNYDLIKIYVFIIIAFFSGYLSCLLCQIRRLKRMRDRF
jgi:hypothetical protein